jgi:4-hydroxybenzoate polyprenyltransferase
MDSLLEPLRFKAWWYAKIPLPVAVSYLVAADAGLSVHQTLERTAGIILTLCCIFAYGYVLNDLLDIEEDKLAGKNNRMAGRGTAARVAWVISPILVFCYLAWKVVGSTSAVLIAGTDFLVVTLYSLPPIRLKGRGAAGAIADGLGAHVLPALFVFPATIGSMTIPSFRTGALLILALAWATCLGFRGIMLHQIADYEYDRTAGVATLAHQFPREELKKLVLRLIFPLEVGAFVSMNLLFAWQAPLCLIALVAYAALESLKHRMDWKLTAFRPETPYSEPYIPFFNNQFYETWWPLSLAAGYAHIGLAGIFHPLLFITLFYPNLRLNGRMNADILLTGLYRSRELQRG